MSAFEFDIFISYNREDDKWAAKLEQSLIGAGINEKKIYRDVTRIKAGDDWNKSLQDSLTKSRHLVVLWTKKAKDSDWVFNEMGKFAAMIDLQDNGESQEGRKLISISLDQQNRATRTNQAIDDLFENKAYEKGIENLDPNVWNAVVQKVARVLNNKSTLSTIALAIVAMTRDRVDELNFKELLPTRRPTDPPETLGDVLDRIGIKSKEELKPYYGNSAADWQPFRSPQVKIRTIMDNVQAESNQVLRNNKLNDKQFQWERVDNYWVDTTEGKLELNKLRTSKAVIVIDPLSLYTNNFRDERFDPLSDCFRNKSALFMVFAPFVLPTPISVLRRLVNARSVQLFNYFYEPNITGDESYAMCGADIGDEADIKRWLLTALRPQISVQQLPAASPAAAILAPKF
jgi:hypothetical protein